MAAGDPTTSPASVAGGARQELLSTGSGTIPSTGGPTKGGWGDALGNVLKTVGLLGTAAALPGFGQAYVQARQHQENLALAEKGQMLRTISKEPALLFNPAMEAAARKTLGPEVTASLLRNAETVRAQEAIQQAMGEFARRNETPSADYPLVSPEGESMGLLSPTGAVVGFGQPALQFQPQPAGVLPGGEVQRETSIDPKGAVTTKLGPVGAAEKERAERQVTTRQISQRQRQLMQQYGFDATEARIAAVQEAQQYGADLSQLTAEDRGLVELAPLAPTEQGQGAPGRGTGAAARKAAEETAARGTATRGVALGQPPKGSYVNPATMELFPSNVNLGDIEKQGGIAVDVATKKALIASRAIEKLINDVDRTAATLFPSDDPQESAMRALKLTELAAKRSTSDPKEKELLQALTTLQGLQARAGQLAQTIGGESGGRLSDQDIQRVFKALPGLRGNVPAFTKYRESRTSAQQLINDMRSEMLTIRQSLLGQALESGTPQAGAAPQVPGEVPQTPVPAGSDDPFVQDILQRYPGLVYEGQQP